MNLHYYSIACFKLIYNRIIYLFATRNYYEHNQIFHFHFFVAE